MTRPDATTAPSTEQQDEHDVLTQVAQEILAGHATWADATLADGREVDFSCMCTGCQIARRMSLLINPPHTSVKWSGR